MKHSGPTRLALREDLADAQLEARKDITTVEHVVSAQQLLSPISAEHGHDLALRLNHPNESDSSVEILTNLLAGGAHRVRRRHDLDRDIRREPGKAHPGFTRWQTLGADERHVGDAHRCRIEFDDE